ncbi:u3 small nucleolar rna-associated protein 18 homolog [Stylonychia lemnae]|uniref:U3 small nucleolar rna-associated protein 18 homolog n=1 Tax=Stylonychia lemnae TaxID=5949 RepID=A0A078ASU4_STYLE|nr:u3 small nucleolar rna-associated protein 18 homolog [Stylonychia lemnae]|eukprot:CDW85091.1 u3 small nucleolar rna-associated protein 18 homolog [Stylonychia lemnae]
MLPAWTDKSLEKITVNIEDKSRLRKLKQTESEKQIKGNEYAERLQDQYSKMTGGSELFSWAALPTQDGNVLSVAQDDEDDDPITKLLKSNANVYQKKDLILKPEKLNFSRLQPANSGHYHESVVTNLQFHPKENILLTCGLDRKAKLFNINSKKSSKIQSIFFPDLPIYNAKFILNGQQIVFSGNRKHFYYYDLATNKIEKISQIMGHSDETNLSKMFVSISADSDYFAFACQESGYILVMSQKTKKLMFQFKMNGSCNSLCFSPDDRYLFSVGDQADIYQWDLESKKCVAKYSDEGSFNTTHICMSPDGKNLATGSYMGIINIYKFDFNTQRIETLSPMKSIMNLTTAITDLKFNPTSQILAVCSKWKKNAIKLIHIPSYTVYQNFPGVAIGVLKFALTIDFSYSSEFLAFGNDEGKAHLFHLSHFSENQTD